jgi:hypothetical protein
METRPFSVGGLIGGLALSLCIGGGLNIIAGLIGMSTNMRLAAFGIGAVPGILFGLLSMAAPKNGFAQGLLIGGCIVALVGGACSASMVGTSFH